MNSEVSHKQLCLEATEKYLQDRSADSDALDWKNALWAARRVIIAFLRASEFLSDVSKALQENGSHSLALRHFLAPPISQDQFKLICPEWQKSAEKSGTPLSKANADAVAAMFQKRRSKRLSPWLGQCRPASLEELAAAIGAIAPLIANQQVSTAQRHRLSSAQEGAVIDLLANRNWQRVQSGLVSTAGQLPAHCFMHKTRFASGPNENQEVDVACGLGGTVVLAMECKVTNDVTNSVKRINDVLKKASAWKGHWGSFVKPAALLQGVIKYSDVQRLLDAEVEVFWAHRLDLFGEWIDSHTTAS